MKQLPSCPVHSVCSLKMSQNVFTAVTVTSKVCFEMGRAPTGKIGMLVRLSSLCHRLCDDVPSIYFGPGLLHLGVPRQYPEEVCVVRLTFKVDSNSGAMGRLSFVILMGRVLSLFEILSFQYPLAEHHIVISTTVWSSLFPCYFPC